MEPDQQLAASIRRRIEIALVRDTRIDVDDASRAVSALCTIVPPETEHRFELITMASGGRGGGVSVKPGNVVVNFKRFGKLSGGMLSYIFANSAGGAIGAALTIVIEASSIARVPIDEEAATVVWALWQSADADGRAGKAGLIDRVNDQRRLHGRSELSIQQLHEALERLQHLRVLKHRMEDPTVWLVEEVRVKVRGYEQPGA